MHHTIEERHLFPILANTMSQFSQNDHGDGAHILSHRGIHDGIFFYDIDCWSLSIISLITGLLNLEKLVEKWTEAPSTYSPTEMRACLDTFREVLFHHLDEEVGDPMHTNFQWLISVYFSAKVADLRGENLVKYMTLEDLERIPI